MATHAMIPVTVSAEAQARINELGLQREFEQMVEHTLRTVPRLSRVSVELGHDYEEPQQPPRVILNAHRPVPDELDRVDWDWGRWLSTTYPPEVFIHFTMLSWYETHHEGQGVP
jgi:hypothetical protein